MVCCGSGLKYPNYVSKTTRRAADIPRRKQHLLKFYDSCQTVKITARHKFPPSLIFSQIFVSLFLGADMPETPGPALLHARLPDCEGGLPGSEFPEPRSNFVITFPPSIPSSPAFSIGRGRFTIHLQGHQTLRSFFRRGNQ